MANLARSREPSLKPAKITKTLPDDANIDITDFRMGKTRIVAKKKKKSALKKLIVAEREVRHELGVHPQAAQGAPAGKTEVSDFNAELDAPEYIPAWTFSEPEKPTQAEDAVTGNAAAPNATAGNAAAPRDGGRKRHGAGLTGAAPEYLPSWIVQGDVAQEAAAPAGEESEHELLVSAAIEHLRVMDAGNKQKKKEKPAQPAKTASNIEVRHYVHQVLSDELDEKVKAFLGELGRFQERARERDPIKFQKQKRFCVGLREASRSVSRGKAKALLMAPNMEASSAEGGLDDTVEDLMDLCREHEVPVVYALSRNRIGKALGKNIRLSIVCILSPEGVHLEFKQIIKLAEELRRQWVMRKMSQPMEEVAQAVDPTYRSGQASLAVSGAPSGVVSGAASDNEDGGAVATTAGLAESISERVQRHLKEKQAEAERKREEERQARAAENAANKERKAKERAAKQAAKRAEQKAAKEAERREQEEQEEKERQAEEERRRALEERDAARQAEIARRDKERKAAEEKRRAAEEAAKAAAAAQKQADAGEDEDEEDSDEDLPIGFCADLL